MAAAAILMLATSGCADRLTYSLAGTNRACQEYRFPQWHFQAFGTPEKMVFRSVGAPENHRVLAAVNAVEASAGISLEKYWISLADPSRIQPATQEDWDRASKLEVQIPERPALKPGAFTPEEVPDSSPVSFHGRSFQKTGRYWVDKGSLGIPSPDGHWIVLQSYDHDRGGGSNPISDGYEPASGPFYIDVFNTGTGKKSFTLTGELHNVTASSFYSNSGWLDGHHLILGLDLSYQALIVCDPTKAK